MPFNLMSFARDLATLKHKTNTLLTVFLLFLVLTDQAAKYFLLKWLPHQVSDTGPGFSLSRVFNEGFVLNIHIKGVDPLFIAIIFILLLSTFIFFYVSALRWLGESFRIIKFGLTVLAGGVFSNILDKIRHGEVLDFIKFQLTRDAGGLFFNTADIFQTIGWIILIYGIIKSRKKLWRTVERRSSFLIDDLHIRKYQMEFISYILWIMACVGLSIFLISGKLFAFSKSIPPAEMPYLISKFVTYYFVMYLIFTVLIMGLTVYFSNKIYGPVYSIKRYLKSLMKEETPPDLKLRKKDQFKEMEELVSKLKDHIADKNRLPTEK